MYLEGGVREGDRDGAGASKGKEKGGGNAVGAGGEYRRRDSDPRASRTAPHLNLPGLLTTANRGAQQAAVVAWLLSGEQVSLCPIAAAPAEFERIARSALCREHAISKQPAPTYLCRQLPALTTAAAAAVTLPPRPPLSPSPLLPRP
jgi:hypothetical protein